ncbi:MAG TPA: SIR2 family protein [Pyrinomonadaceae bacterium]|nr:SIR2 family protein [Pyrinomonadaceae bacterium]
MNGNISEQASEIIKKIEKGNCTLFLGAGASLSSNAPTGESLSRLITEKFFLQRGWDMSVDHAFSLGLANRNPGAIESFVVTELNNLEPSPSHKIIPWFRWRAIITTNYDQLIEKAYQPGPVTQRLAPILNETDLPKVGLPLEEYVPLLKPHGCISDSRNMSLGLEGIHAAKKERRLIFSYIEMLHLAGPVIYIGYSLRDSHIIDMICELKDRLGDRTEILFVTKQDDQVRNRIERAWFERTLRVEYLDWGFEGFMRYIAQNLDSQIGLSKIVPQLTPCRIIKFGDISYKIRRTDPGKWDCWIDYAIKDPEDYVGIIFQTKNAPIDISQYEQIQFELNIPDSPRQENVLEAIKLEGYNRSHSHVIDLSNFKPGEWRKIVIDLDKFQRPGVRSTSIRQVVLTDTGRLAPNDQRYEFGVRGVTFVSGAQKPPVPEPPG